MTATLVIVGGVLVGFVILFAVLAASLRPERHRAATNTGTDGSVAWMGSSGSDSGCDPGTDTCCDSGGGDSGGGGDGGGGGGGD